VSYARCRDRFATKNHDDHIGKLINNDNDIVMQMVIGKHKRMLAMMESQG
jgi:hypothetical protein